jgi:hypothetical protein
MLMNIHASISLVAMFVSNNNAVASLIKEIDMATQAISRDIIAFQQGIDTSSPPGPGVCLAKGELFAVAEGDWRLLCLSGALWLTRDGDQEDYILRAGDQFSISRGDRAAVQALRPASIRLFARH